MIEDKDKEKDSGCCQSNMGQEGPRQDKIESLKPDHDVHDESCGCGEKKDEKNLDR